MIVSIFLIRSTDRDGGPFEIARNAERVFFVVSGAPWIGYVTEHHDPVPFGRALLVAVGPCNCGSWPPTDRGPSCPTSYTLSFAPLYPAYAAARIVGGAVFKKRGKPINGWSEADRAIAKQYREWRSQWTPEWYRVLKPGANGFIFASRRLAHRCVCAMEDAGFSLRDNLAWIRALGHRMEHNA